MDHACAAGALAEAGASALSYATLKRRLPAYAKGGFRARLSAACAAHARLGPATLVLYDVSTLYFETDAGDGFRESGFSKERRPEPQITIGLLTGADGFLLMISAFEGNKAETRTMLPVIQSFMAAHDLPDVTIVADAGMVSEANQKKVEAAGLSFILGARIPQVPYHVAQWRREHPGEAIPDGHIFTQRWPALDGTGRRDQIIYCQYRADRGRRTLRGIDEQVKKAEQAIAGKTPVKRNRSAARARGRLPETHHRRPRPVRQQRRRARHTHGQAPDQRLRLHAINGRCRELLRHTLLAG
jgi:Transposase DDE domain